MSALMMTIPYGLPSGAITGLAISNVGTCGVSTAPFSAFRPTCET